VWGGNCLAWGSGGGCGGGGFGGDLLFWVVGLLGFSCLGEVFLGFVVGGRRGWGLGGGGWGVLFGFFFLRFLGGGGKLALVWGGGVCGGGGGGFYWIFWVTVCG